MRPWPAPNCLSAKNLWNGLMTSTTATLLLVKARKLKRRVLARPVCEGENESGCGGTVWLHALCCKKKVTFSQFFPPDLTDSRPYMHACVHMHLTVHSTVCLP